MPTDNRTQEEKQKKAFAILVTCLVSVGDATEMNETYTADLMEAAELMGISRLELLEVAARPVREI